jgi:hypothetical protein
MGDKSSAVPVATAAIITGILGALVGALMLGARRTAAVHLHPEHPLFGR